MTDSAVAHYYRKFRAESPMTPAIGAFNSARSFVAFRAQLSADVKASKKRSAAAKKAAKTRKARA